MVEALTDNRNRPGSAIRSAFSKHGGSMAEPGAVAWQFERKGVLSVPKRPRPGVEVSDDDLMMAALDAGVEDIHDSGEAWEVTTAPGDLGAVRTALEGAGIAFDSADLTMVASTNIQLQ